MGAPVQGQEKKRKMLEIKILPNNYLSNTNSARCRCMLPMNGWHARQKSMGRSMTGMKPLVCAWRYHFSISSSMKRIGKLPSARSDSFTDLLNGIEDLSGVKATFVEETIPREK